jgi:hypothetical protein
MLPKGRLTPVKEGRMSATRKETGRFKVGDWVSFPYGARNLTAQIVEARGPLGINGRHLYRIRVAREFGEPDSFELPGDDLELAPAPHKSAIVRYLQEGGLVAILRANLGGGHNQPKAWLTYTPRGGITHTFDPEQGVMGGSTVPFFALHEGRVFVGKEEEVIGFLASFGLDRPEAAEILAGVGTAP